MPRGSLILGVDLVPIKPIPHTITLQGDISTEKCATMIRGTLKAWEADIVIHDGAPNVGAAWIQDAYSQSELVLQATKLAIKFLKPGGTFVTKIFRSKDYNALVWIFQQLFATVEATKPPASRNISAEIYVFCRGFKAPKHLDPRFLDSRHVFAETPSKKQTDESKVLQPEIKNCKSVGYAGIDWYQFKEASAIEFVEATDPIAILASMNRLTFEPPSPGGVALVALAKLPETTSEVRACCDDLKVLGKKEFRALLRWRVKCLEKLAIEISAPKTQSRIESRFSNGEVDFESSLKHQYRQLAPKEKRRKRKENQSKRRELRRLQMHMQAPTDLDIGEFSAGGGTVLEPLILEDLESNNAATGAASPSLSNSDESNLSQNDSSDDELRQLDVQLNDLYTLYKSRKSSTFSMREDSSTLDNRLFLAPEFLMARIVLTITIALARTAVDPLNKLKISQNLGLAKLRSLGLISTDSNRSQKSTASMDLSSRGMESAPSTLVRISPLIQRSLP